ncbi:type II toxin-antitoxin system death-on-curing family toxin [Balneolaceae bacterium ANBcel3]|nr:type II toxin-antitoxin system death-on-curing family toxin [Balneolaceae bacterium ANBcel3]
MIRFLDKATLLIFHKDQLERYGGASGIRDEALLESALAQPQATFDGAYVHEDIFHMATAYAYHLCQNHPFYDGNKRTALIAMYMFLYVNGYQMVSDKKSLYAIIMDLAKGKVSKEELREYLIANTKKR